MTREELLQLFKNRNWEIIKNISFDNLVALLNYQECMSLAYDLFAENIGEDDYLDLSIRLFFFIRDNFLEEWNTDWKNDAFLGQLCGLTWRYSQRFDCYKRAYDKLSDPPDSLLLLISGSNSTPDAPPISDQESEMYLKRALAKKLTFEAAVKMRGLARRKKDSNLEIYWDKMCKELKQKNIHVEAIIPFLFQNKIIP